MFYTIPTKNTFYKKGIGSIAEIIEVQMGMKPLK